MLRPAAVYLCLLGLLLLSIPSALRAGEEEFDYARFKLQLNGWVSSPTGYFNGKNGNGYSDVQRDFGFGNYVTFAGRVDWRFKRKHHLFFVTTPVISSRTPAEFSPIPPVKTTASAPPIAARYAPMYFFTR